MIQEIKGGMSAYAKIKEEAQAEIQEELNKKYKEKVKTKLRDLEKAKRIVKNIEREIEDLEYELSECD